MRFIRWNSLCDYYSKIILFKVFGFISFWTIFGHYADAWRGHFTRLRTTSKKKTNKKGILWLNAWAMLSNEQHRQKERRLVHWKPLLFGLNEIVTRIRIENKILCTVKGRTFEWQFKVNVRDAQTLLFDACMFSMLYLFYSHFGNICMQTHT